MAMSIPNLSICAIMKNEERFLPGFLENFQSSTNDLVVLDTGSTDNSLDICKAHGVQVHHFEWVNHFAKARNACLEKAKNDWILMVDIDDRASEETLQAVAQCLANATEDAVYFPYLSVSHEDWKSADNPVKASQQRLMLFRNNKGYHYRFPIHEDIEGLVEELGGRFIYRREPFIHLGYIDSLEKEKEERNSVLIRNEYERDPENPLNRYNFSTLVFNENREFYELLKPVLKCDSDYLVYGAAQRLLIWKDRFGGEVDEEELVSLMLDLNPKSSYVHLRNGRRAFAERDLKKARECFEIAKKGFSLELLDKDFQWEILDRLGVLYGIEGRFSQALACFLEMEEKFGRSPGSWHQVLKCRYAMKDFHGFMSEMKAMPVQLSTLESEKAREILTMVEGLNFTSKDVLLDLLKKELGVTLV